MGENSEKKLGSEWNLHARWLLDASKKSYKKLPAANRQFFILT
jgi:hypothetical protein